MVACVAYLRINGDRVPEAIDALSFHLPDVVRWTQQHGFWQIHQFIPDLAHGNYPNNGDVLSLLAVLNFHDLGLVRLVFVPWLFLTGVGVHALARELGAPRASAAVFGAVAAGLPIVARSALLGVAPDVVMYASFSAGLAFLVRHRRTGGGAELVSAGLGLGLALGTKWYGLSAFVVVLVAWAGLRVVDRVAARRLLADGGLLVGVVLLAGGFWLLRNLILSANPVFPVKVALGGVTLFHAPFDVVRARGGFTLAHYASDGIGLATLHLAGIQGRLRVRADRLRGGGDRRGGARPLAAAARGDGRAGRRAGDRLRDDAVLGPGTGRAAGAGGREHALRRARAAGGGGAVRRGGRAAGSPAPVAEAIGALLALDGVRRAFHVPGHTIATTIVILALLLVAAWALRALSMRRRLAPLAAAIVLVVAFGVARRLDTHLDHTAWQADPALAWVREHADGGQRIGLAGRWPTDGGVAPILPAFGDRLSNRVTYIGPFEHHMLRQYSQSAARSSPACAAIGSGCSSSAAASRARSPRRARSAGRARRACTSSPAAIASRCTGAEFGQRSVALAELRQRGSREPQLFRLTGPGPGMGLSSGVWRSARRGLIRRGEGQDCGVISARECETS